MDVKRLTYIQWTISTAGPFYNLGIGGGYAVPFEGNITAAKVAADWKVDSLGDSYTSVFAILYY